MSSVLDFADIDEKYQRALIFSLFEGLLEGKAFCFTSNSDPGEIIEQFNLAKVTNFKVDCHQDANRVWKVVLHKEYDLASQNSAVKGGCCGLCLNS